MSGMTHKQKRAWQRLQEREATRTVRPPAGEWEDDDDGNDDDQDRPLLWSGNFFPLLLGDMAKAGLVGEKRNALATYVIGTSRLRERPLNEMVKGKSGAGKNHLVKTVCKFFPSSEVVPATSLSEHAIHYIGEDALSHKILYVDELGGLTHPARQLISEGRIIHRVTGFKDGKRVAEEHVTRGPVTCITTTTENALLIDDESRNFSVWINESDAQTKAIAKAVVTTGLEVLRPERLAMWHRYQRHLAKIAHAPIAIPPWFEDIVEKVLPFSDLRIRRYWPAFIEACKVVCMILHPFWDKRAARGLTISFDDFAVANCIFDGIIAQSLTRAGRDEDLATADIVERLSYRQGPEPISVSAGDLMGEPGIRSLDRAYRLLRRAEQAGTITLAELPRKNNEKRYVRATEATFLGSPELIVQQIRLKIAGTFMHPIRGLSVEYGNK
jgi:hypothetical protein